MLHVALSGTCSLSLPNRNALARTGWRVATGPVPFGILCGADVSEDVADATRDFVLAGGRLLILGGGGPLLARLQLTRLMEPMDPAVAGLAEALQPPFESVQLACAHPVTGAGYALLRVGERIVALGGPRGKGHLVYAAVSNPPPELVLPALRWLVDRA